MEQKKRYSIKKILLAILWLGVTAAVSVLLVAAIHKNDTAKCAAVNIKILGIATDEKFVDENDVLHTIETICGANPVGKSSGSFNLRAIEAELQKSDWIKSAQLFFDNAAVLQVKIYEREPAARVFTAGGHSFYIDTALKMLPLSDKFSARLPVFTGFPSDAVVLSAADSSLLNGVKEISLALQSDSFCMAMIEQVDITAQRHFEMIPKIGNQLIVFGSAEDAVEKCKKLKLFYKNILVKSGWSQYSVINVQYKNQVVAKRRGQEDKTADSVRTLQLMQQIAANAARMAEDSVSTIMPDNSSNTADSTIIQQSIQREENIETSNAYFGDPLQPENPPVVKQPVANPLPSAKQPAVQPKTIKPVPAKPVPVKPVPVSAKPPAAKTNPAPVKKPTVTKTNTNATKPKVIMPPKNDY
jgi:cell division protein FtsQ